MSNFASFAQAAHTTAGNRRSSPAFAVLAALAIVAVACALGRATFQADPGAWPPYGASESSSVGQ